MLYLLGYFFSSIEECLVHFSDLSFSLLVKFLVVFIPFSNEGAGYVFSLKVLLYVVVFSYPPIVEDVNNFGVKYFFKGRGLTTV